MQLYNVMFDVEKEALKSSAVRERRILFSDQIQVNCTMLFFGYKNFRF